MCDSKPPCGLWSHVNETPSPPMTPPKLPEALIIVSEMEALASQYSEDSNNCFLSVLVWTEKHAMDSKKDPFVIVVNEGSADFARMN